jgi:hypothetical protein
LVLWRDGEEMVINTHKPGSSIVISRELWITTRPHKKSSMIFYPN